MCPVKLGTERLEGFQAGNGSVLPSGVLWKDARECPICRRLSCEKITTKGHFLHSKYIHGSESRERSLSLLVNMNSLAEGLVMKDSMVFVASFTCSSIRISIS